MSEYLDNASSVETSFWLLAVALSLVIVQLASAELSRK